MECKYQSVLVNSGKWFPTDRHSEPNIRASSSFSEPSVGDASRQHVNPRKALTTGFTPGLNLDLQRGGAHPDHENPFSPANMMAGCIHNSGPIEAALKTALETGSFDTGTFDNVTEEAYYLVHPLRGSLLFRAIEQASYDDSKLGEMDQVLGLLRELDPDDAWAASFASYEYHGTNTIHAFHFAASLGNVEVLRRLKAYYSDTVINLRSTITRSASKDVSRSNNGGSLAVTGSMSIHVEHYSPLLGAVYMSRTEAAIWLLENSADPNLPNVDSQTAVHILAKSGMPGENVWRQEEATEQQNRGGNLAPREQCGPEPPERRRPDCDSHPREERHARRGCLEAGGGHGAAHHKARGVHGRPGREDRQRRAPAGLAVRDDRSAAGCEQEVLLPEAHDLLACRVLSEAGGGGAAPGPDPDLAGEPRGCGEPDVDGAVEPDGQEAAPPRGPRRQRERPREQARRGVQDGAL
eukprot:CAMPEP_0175799900 /NCGR_PEP_ID=MMETSP0097-20121207/86742_1 /TAXON_ID=311494 /ORGANISM="Alexandrium monilatum, Strain CCMP3105" /LENGTH=465 /DNA_ID=CAMNT_0017111177 /DNA_START=60 /DNA_END=1455 /DNA_ORIENTATION=-